MIDEEQETTTVSFRITDGDVWVDPGGTAWYVDFVVDGKVHLHRRAATQVDTKTLVREWRRPNQ